MLDPGRIPVTEPEPESECIKVPVPVPLRQKLPVPVPQHCCRGRDKKKLTGRAWRQCWRGSCRWRVRAPRMILLVSTHLFSHWSIPLMLEAALFPRKLASNFRFFDICIHFMLDPGQNSGYGTGTRMHYGSSSGSAEAKTSGSGSGSTTLWRNHRRGDSVKVMDNVEKW